MLLIPTATSLKVIQDSIQLLGQPLTTGRGDWVERRREFIDKVEIHKDLVALTEKAKNNEISLALFKPTEVTNFKHKRFKYNSLNGHAVNQLSLVVLG